MTKKKRNPKLSMSANMPPLFHKLPGEKYNRKNSEVLKWLSERPGLFEYVFDQASNAKEIVYDSETGKWQGADYEGDEE